MEGCASCNLDACLTCKDGFYLNDQQACAPCELEPEGSDFFVLQNRCKACSKEAPSSCKICKYGFLGSKSNPDECELICGDGHFPSIEFSTSGEDRNKIESTTCLECDPSCKTCLNSLSLDQCLTCYADSYLLIADVSQQTGTCLLKQQTTPSTIDIFVTNEVPEDAHQRILDPSIGSFGNPLWNILDAFKLARDKAAPFSSDSIIVMNFMLFQGDHFAIRDHGDSSLIYRSTLTKGQKNLNYFITVLPLSCYYSGVNVTRAMLDGKCTDGEVTIYNKQRDQFSIEVPRGLTL